jgi:hypothetical protein
VQANAKPSFFVPRYVFCSGKALADFVLKKALTEKPAFRHPIKLATIRLQWNRKPKMMRPA